MSNSLVASLQLQIAEYQANLAKATGESEKWKQKLQQQGKQGAGAVDQVAASYNRVTQAAQASQRVISANTALFLQAEKAASASARAMQAGRGTKGMQIGGAAMQVQDIAVQLQMGTKLSTVIAQQGSQMLSMFGAGGAVFGGLVAVGGAFVTMGDAARKSLDETISGAKGLRGEIDLLAQGGSIDEVSAKLAAIGTTGAAAFKELNSFNTLKGGFWTELLAVFGGPSGNEKFAGLQAGIMAGAEGKQVLQQRLLDLSAQELAMAQLKAAGDEEALARMQQEIALAQELARIQRLNISDPAKAQLTADATSRSALGASTAKDPKKTAQDISAIQKRMNEERLASLPAHERYFELSDMQQKVFQRMDQEGGVFFEKSHEGLQQWAALLEKSGKGEALLGVLKIMEEVNGIQKEMDAALKASNDERDRQQQLMDRQHQAADKQRTDAFISTLGLPAGSSMPAIAAAQQAAAMPLSTKARQFTEADRQAGWMHPSLRAGKARLMGGAGGGGLDQHFRNQQNASQWEMLQRGTSDWQALQNRAAGFGTRQSASASASERNNNPKDPISIMKEQLAVLRQGLLG